MESNLCNFYTVRYDNCEVSETDKFYDKYWVDDGKYLDDIEQIHMLMKKLSVKGLSIISRVRPEASALALPPKSLKYEINQFDNKLRLYYIEISPGIVILFGGGIAHENKFGKTPIQLREAISFVKRISSSKNTSFEIQNGMLIPVGGDDIIIN